MKKTVITFGLISGAVSALLLGAILPFQERIGFENGALVGYTIIVLSCLMIFPGIRSYREKVGSGQITFGRAFAVGILITLVSSACYVIAWEIIYYNFMPDFCDKYAAFLVAKLKASGAGQQAIDKTMQDMNWMKGIMNNPLTLAAFGLIEPLPVGLLVTVISAAILRKKTSGRPGEAAAAAAIPQMISE